MASPPIKTLKELNEDNDHLWRVLMFGEAHLNTGRSTEPLIDVFAAPLKGEPEKPDDKGNTDYKATRSVRIGVGQLPQVFIGSVWHQGLPQPRTAYRYSFKRFNSLTIAPWTTSIIPLGQKLGSWWNAFHLAGDDFKQSRYWSPMSQATCVAVASRGRDFRVIIPVVELIRFYYIQTSRLAITVFTPDIYDLGGICNLDKSVLTRREDDDGERYIHMVHLRQRFYNADAWIIARWVYSDLARSKARQIHKSLMTASNESRPTFPETNFPFIGKTDLKVIGRWIRAKDRVRRFLVYRILECSGPWEFNELMVGRDNDGRSDNTPDEGKPTAFPGAQKAAPNEIDEDSGEIQSDEDPDAGVGDTAVESALQMSRFTPLKDKEIVRAPKEPTRYRGRKRNSDSDERHDWSTGDGTWGKTESDPIIFVPGGGKALEEELVEETNVDEAKDTNKDEKQTVPTLSVSFVTIERVLHVLSDEAYGVTFNFINPYRRSNYLDEASSEEEAKASNTTFFPTIVKGQKRRWSFIKRNPDEVREALIVKLTWEGKSYYLFEMSRRPTEEGKYMMALIRKGEGDVLGSHTLDAILQACVLNRGGWLRENELTELSRHYLKHGSKFYERYADRFYSLMIDESKWME